MGEPTVLYKVGTAVKIEGSTFDYITVDSDELDSYISEGWFKSVNEALSPHEALPTRAELEQKATELGITFRQNIGDKSLRAKIEAAL